MGNIFVGKIVSTHGFKGEVKIISDFQFKDKVFKVGKALIVDDNKYIIKSYRHHKNFEMVTLNDYKDINEVLFLMKKKVYFNEDDLELSNSEVLDSELVTYSVFDTNGNEGEILEIFLASLDNKIMRVKFDREVLIPINSPMIKEINKEKKMVIVELISGM